MKFKLHYNTVPPQVLKMLVPLMQAKELEDFRLVGGTALSLQIGHRISVDIDMFTDSAYNTIDFERIDSFLRNTWSYVETSRLKPIGMGKSYFIGSNSADCIKLDLFYTDKFIDDVKIVDGIRLATVDEIIAMKVDIIQRGGRKKDFWDIHELLDDYPMPKLLELHEKRYPFNHDRSLLLMKFKDFSGADIDFNPICLRGKHWELIKLDIIDFVDNAFLHNNQGMQSN